LDDSAATIWVNDWISNFEISDGTPAGWSQNRSIVRLELPETHVVSKQEPEASLTSSKDALELMGAQRKSIGEMRCEFIRKHIAPLAHRRSVEFDARP